MAERVRATFESERDAERAVEALIAAGLDAEAVTLVSPAGPLAVLLIVPPISLGPGSRPAPQGSRRWSLRRA
jgi:hypothetical protein